MNELSRLKIETEELSKSVNLIKDRIGKVKYNSVENYYLTAPAVLYTYEAKGESFAITSGRIDNTNPTVSVSLYIDSVLVDKKYCLQDGSFSFEYVLPQSKKSMVKIVTSEQNVVIKSARTLLMGNVAILYSVCAKAYSDQNGTVYAREKSGLLYVYEKDEEVFVGNTRIFDVAKRTEEGIMLIKAEQNNLVLCMVKDNLVVEQNLYTFNANEEQSLTDLCAFANEEKIIVVCIIGREMRYFCFNETSKDLHEQGSITTSIQPFSVCFIKNAQSPILIANASDKNYIMTWIE